MEGHRLTREDRHDSEEQLPDPERWLPDTEEQLTSQGEADSPGTQMHTGGGWQESSEFAMLRQLLEKQALVQEQRWRSVQLQLNQLREDVEAERRPSPIAAAVPVPVLAAAVPVPVPAVPVPAAAAAVPVPVPAAAVPVPVPAAAVPVPAAAAAVPVPVPAAAVPVPVPAAAVPVPVPAAAVPVPAAAAVPVPAAAAAVPVPVPAAAAVPVPAAAAVPVPAAAAVPVPVPAAAVPVPVPMPTAPPCAAPVAWSRGAIPKLEDTDDIEQYLTTFERLARAYRWPREDWAVFLVPYLTGKARSAYVAMDVGQSMDYDRVKEAILAKYEINAEVYRRRFREPDVRVGETPRELYNRLKDLFDKWIRPSTKTVEEVAEVLILEQFMRTLAPDIRVWVKEREPRDAQRAAELVESFMAARNGLKRFRHDPQQRPPARGKSDGFGHGGGPRFAQPNRVPAHTSAPASAPAYVPVRPRSDPQSRSTGPIICHYCKQEGHIIAQCPARKPKYSSHSCIPRPEGGLSGLEGKLQIMAVVVNGKPVTALLDSGSTQTLVQPHLVERRDMVVGKSLRVLCVNGDEHEYPIAEVYVEISGQTYQLSVGVVEKLSHPIVIGQDIVVLPELLQAIKPVYVVTRSQSAAHTDEEANEDSPDSLAWKELAFCDADITSPARVRPKKSRSQRRRARLVGTVGKDLPVWAADDIWEDVPGDFEKMQREDASLAKAFEKVTQCEGKGNSQKL
ncbi:hypothetical protein ACEWY4_010162 [Coilia grayii]|uniref:SCAN box domain-containing protein n=1 Tax=Coilia grayii TaxID=363190 RepID=A0ABD1K8H2_9TELE